MGDHPRAQAHQTLCPGDAQRPQKRRGVRRTRRGCCATRGNVRRGRRLRGRPRDATIGSGPPAHGHRTSAPGGRAPVRHSEPPLPRLRHRNFTVQTAAAVDAFGVGSGVGGACRAGVPPPPLPRTQATPRPRHKARQDRYSVGTRTVHGGGLQRRPGTTAARPAPPPPPAPSYVAQVPHDVGGGGVPGAEDGPAQSPLVPGALPAAPCRCGRRRTGPLAAAAGAAAALWGGGEGGGAARPWHWATGGGGGQGRALPRSPPSSAVRGAACGSGAGL